MNDAIRTAANKRRRTTGTTTAPRVSKMTQIIRKAAGRGEDVSYAKPHGDS